MRALIHVSIIHTEVDFGPLTENIKNRYVARYGIEKWRQHLNAIDDLWKEIRERVMALPLHYSQVKLYQDGLPVCDRELDIVRDLAGRGSKNHQLVIDLVNRGATLIGTEEPELLVEEYHRVREALDNPIPVCQGTGRSAAGPKGFRESAEPDSLMLNRDRYIAKRIDETLQDGETGIVFLGLMHRLEQFLPPDVIITYLLPEIREKGGNG